MRKALTEVEISCKRVQEVQQMLLLRGSWFTSEAEGRVAETGKGIKWT